MTLQEKGCLKKAPKRGTHRKRRERFAKAGMLIHQDGRFRARSRISLSPWIMHYSMFFVGEEGTHSSLLGVKELMEQRGLFCMFYSDRGNHYWHTPKAGKLQYAGKIIYSATSRKPIKYSWYILHRNGEECGHLFITKPDIYICC